MKRSSSNLGQKKKKKTRSKYFFEGNRDRDPTIGIYSRYFILCWSGPISRRTGCHWPVIYCGIERCKRVEYGGRVIVARLSHVRSASGDNRYTGEESNFSTGVTRTELRVSRFSGLTKKHPGWTRIPFFFSRILIYLISGPGGLACWFT